MLKKMRRISSLLCLLLVSTHGRSQANPNASNFEATRKSVVFIYFRDAQGQEHPDGTGFLLQIPTKRNPARGYVLLVTARHMADPGWMGCPVPIGDLIARFNKKTFNPQTDEVGTVDYDLKGQQWIAPDDTSIDIAYTLLNGSRIDKMDVDNAPLRIEVLPTASEVASVGIGDSISSAGLLENASGTKRNYPVFKFGNVSSIPDEKIPVPSGCGSPPKLMAEWLIAASLVPGNSGSPIIFYPSPLQAGRPFILGVQSISFGVQFPTFTGTSDVAGMAPIRPLLESIRELHLEDADLSRPTEATSSTNPTPTSIPTPFPAKPGPLPVPK